MASARIVTANQRICDIQNEPCKMLLPIEGYQDLPLLPLDVSVEPLENVISNIVRNAWIAKERTNERPSNILTQEESAAIQLYTMEWRPTDQSLYLKLNAALRAENRDLLVPYFAYLKLVLSALFKLQSVKKTVWRGVKADLSSQYPVGKTFVWWGFSSCTESLTLLESKKFLGDTGIRTLFNIECESGKEIHQHSYFQKENEILVLPATQFQVLGKINPAPGFYIIHLKETKPPFPLLQSPFNQSSNQTTATAHLSDTMSTKTYHNRKLESMIQEKSTLEFAEFREKQLNDEDAHLIANELARNTCWISLDLVDNKIGPIGAASLSSALELNSTLQQLLLEDNQLGDAGTTFLASALNINKTVIVLRLEHNHIADLGAEQLANMLEINTSLMCIELCRNQIGDLGMAALATALKLNTTLIYINLDENRITDQSVGAITDMIRQTKTLDFLPLRNNKFSTDGKNRLNRETKQSRIFLYL